MFSTCFSELAILRDGQVGMVAGLIAYGLASGAGGDVAIRQMHASHGLAKHPDYDR